MASEIGILQFVHISEIVILDIRKTISDIK